MERFAFCVEFGGNLWRMLIFGEQLEEQSVPHFSGAQIGKWFKELEGGVFKPINDEQQTEMETNLGISLQMDGLDRGICLKIRLPVLLNQSYGFFRNCPDKPFAKFTVSIDPSIHGNVHFDIAHLDQTKCSAFISLQSFNCPSTGNENYQKWSIRSPKDIIVECEREITGQLPDQPAEGEEHFEDVFVCWKMENDSTTFIGFNDGVNQNKCAANQLINYLIVAGSLRSFLVDINLGEWYKIEYCHRNDQIFILNIQPTEYKEKLFKTRVNNGIVQFEAFIRKTPHGFETLECGVEIIGIPAELQYKWGLIGWCTLGEEFMDNKNELLFYEESQNANQQKANQSQAQNNSEMASTNGNLNSIEGEAALPFPIQNNSKIVSSNANAKFSIKKGGFGRGPGHNRLLTNFMKTGGKYSDLATLEDHSMANAKMDEEFPEPIEVTVPEYLIEVIRENERLNADWDFDCQLERSPESMNVIRIVGSSKEKMTECAKHIKITKDMLIKENKKKEEAINMEENSVEKINILPNNEEQKTHDIFEWHSQHQGVDWLDMVVAEENKQVANLVEELMQKMAPASADEAIMCEVPSIDQRRMASIDQGKMPSIEETIECEEAPKVITPKMTIQQKIQARPPPLEFGCKYFSRPNEKRPSPNFVASSSTNVGVPSSFSSSKSSPTTKNLALSLSNNVLVHVSKNYHSLVIGKNGNNLKRLELKYKVKIEIPAKHLPDENITISGNNPIQMDACKEDILDMIERVKMEEMPVMKDFVIIPTNDQNHKAVDYAKFLIGSNGSKISELRTTFPAIKIEMPYPERGDRPIIHISGLKSDVEGNQIELFVEVEQKYHERFLDKRGKLLQELKEQHSECTFFFNKTENRIEIRGTLENADKAKEAVRSIICENNHQPILDPEIRRMIDQVYMDTFEELMQQIAGGSKQNC